MRRPSPSSAPNRDRPVQQRLKFAGFTLGSAALLVIAAGALIAWSGIYDIAATAKHPWPVAMLLHFVMERSVAHNAEKQVPPDLNDSVRVLRGAMHFASGCAPCHGAPGQLASPIAQQMTPVPPGLYSASRDFDPSELFFIVKHGVKMTAMPAWPSQRRDDEVWAMVAFLEHLPEMTPDEYARLTGGDSSRSVLAGPRPGFDPARCSGCHGTDGKGRDGAFPAIDGMSRQRMIAALHAYRDGSRPSGFMQPVAAAMSQAQIEAAAAYYAGLGKADRAETP